MTHRTETLDTVLPGNAGNGFIMDRHLYRAAVMRCALTFLLAAAFVLPSRVASPAAEASARLLAQAEPRLKAIYETDEFRMRSFRATWLPDGSGYLKLETPAGVAGGEIARYDSASGKRMVVVAGEKLLVPTTNQHLKIRGFVRSPSGKRFLLHTESTPGEDGSSRWLYEPETGALRPVKAGRGARFGSDAFSPDEQRLLGSRGADLIVYDLAGGRTIPLTKDGNPDAIDNGGASWSPDGQWIAHVQPDSFGKPTL